MSLLNGGGRISSIPTCKIGVEQRGSSKFGGQNQTFKLGDTEFNSPYSAAVSHQLSRQQRLQEMSFKKKKITGQVEHGERTERVASLAIPRTAAQSAQIFGGGQILPITSSVLDYEEVAIPEDSVIYCDIPYEGTDGYLEKGQGGFDYERFYQWCERQTQPVFISSYQMPEDRFDCIEEFTHRSTLSATANNLVTERIYVPKHQAERGNRIVQLTLF